MLVLDADDVVDIFPSIYTSPSTTGGRSCTGDYDAMATVKWHRFDTGLV